MSLRTYENEPSGCSIRPFFISSFDCTSQGSCQLWILEKNTWPICLRQKRRHATYFYYLSPSLSHSSSVCVCVCYFSVFRSLLLTGFACNLQAISSDIIPSRSDMSLYCNRLTMCVSLSITGISRYDTSGTDLCAPDWSCRETSLICRIEKETLLLPPLNLQRIATDL